jgi:acetyl-CoA decarbonylase/synthase complex subunit delta
LAKSKEKDSEKILKDFFNFLNNYEEFELQGVTLYAEELEISIQPAMQGVSDVAIRRELGKAFAELGRILGSVGTVSSQQSIQQAAQQAPSLQPPTVTPKPPRLIKLPELEYNPPIKEYPGKIAEVKLGATRAEGGTRSKVITIGGETMPAFNLFEGKQKNPPVIAGDVFDIPIPLPSPVRKHFKDALEDPCEWAKLWVNKYGADLIDFELISTDPYIKDTPISESVKLVENMLQAVDVPLVIGGSGNPEKDARLLPKIAEVCEGERVMLSSATLDMWEPVAQAAKKYKQVVLAWTSIDVNQAKELNRKLLSYLPKEQIVIDPTSAALGYGIEYAFTVMERIRLAAILGDEELQCPQGSGTANSWGAREAWRKEPELGPRELRGPLWETVGALTYLLAGIDLFIMLHPLAARTLKDVISWLMGESKKPTFIKLLGG